MPCGFCGFGLEEAATAMSLFCALHLARCATIMRLVIIATGDNSEVTADTLLNRLPWCCLLPLCCVATPLGGMDHHVRDHHVRLAAVYLHCMCVNTDVGLEETAVFTTGCRCLTGLLTVLAESQLRCATLHPLHSFVTAACWLHLCRQLLFLAGFIHEPHDMTLLFNCNLWYVVHSPECTAENNQSQSQSLCKAVVYGA